MAIKKIRIKRETDILDDYLLGRELFNSLDAFQLAELKKSGIRLPVFTYRRQTKFNRKRIRKGKKVEKVKKDANYEDFLASLRENRRNLPLLMGISPDIDKFVERALKGQ